MKSSRDYLLKLELFRNREGYAEATNKRRTI